METRHILPQPDPHCGRARVAPLAPLLAILALAMGLLAGCDKASSESKQLPIIQLQIAGQSLETEIAQSEQSQQRGLMYRNSMPENHGMLFLFPSPRQASFWMRNTRIPLSIAYLNSTGKILEIHDMQPFDETSIRSESTSVSYALEVNQGWFRRNGIGPGDQVSGLDKIAKNP